MYSVRYGTGAGDKDGFETLEAAKEYADDNISYTQNPVIVTDDYGNEICIRRWWGVQYDDERYPEEDPILFARYGYYSDWEDLD